MNITKSVPFIVTKYNYVHENYGETGFGPSQAVPDQTLPIREILRRHASGLPVMGNIRKPIYEDDEIPPFGKMDLVDLQEYAQQLNEEVDKIDKAQKKRQKDEADAKYKDQIRRELEEERQQELPPEPPTKLIP